MVLDDGLTEVLMSQLIIMQEIVIKKMTERPVPNVMQQTGDPHIFLNERSGRAVIAENFL
jgi:hypothetical protein